MAEHEDHEMAALTEAVEMGLPFEVLEEASILDDGTFQNLRRKYLAAAKGANAEKKAKLVKELHSIKRFVEGHYSRRGIKISKGIAAASFAAGFTSFAFNPVIGSIAMGAGAANYVNAAARQAAAGSGKVEPFLKKMDELVAEVKKA